METVTVKVGGECREVGLREAWQYVSPEEYREMTRESELRHFHDTHNFCGVCGSRTVETGEISRHCPECGRDYFPSISPAIAVLVKRGEKALLVHARNFTHPMFALVAGFVEPGENLEECVAREIKEETTLSVTNIRYFGSQSWPFPSQLMVGFIAEWQEGEISFADGELTDGGWFTRENPPRLPTMPSLSRVIIDSWIKGEM